MIAHGKDIKIFSGNSNPELAKAICAKLGLPLGSSETKTFSDGESSVSIYETVRGSDVFVIQSTCMPVNDNLMDLLIMIDALKRASAGRITAVIPYFGYARQDRKTKPRDPISAKLVANLITRAGADRVLTMDLHANQIQGFFDIPVDNLFGNPIFVDYYAKKFGAHCEDMVVVSPDVGSVARARTFAQKLHMNLAIVDKRRQKANQCEVMNVIGDVEGKECILFDDMVDTAGSLCNAAKAVVEVGGAKKVYACASHGVLSGPALERLEASCIEELALLDTIPAPVHRKAVQLRAFQKERRKAALFYTRVIVMFFGKKVTGPAEWLLVCLGNYGKQYENTRHNIGFMAAERLIDKQGLRCNRLRFRALTELIEFGGARVLLMMPQTYMNLSGEAVGEAARFYKIPSDHVLVIYDDVSLPLGKLRIRDKGSAGGHNGIKNIIAHLGTDVFPRVKVGVGAPSHPDYDMVDWVIGSFSAQERKIVDEALDRALDAAECIISRGVTEAQNRFN